MIQFATFWDNIAEDYLLQPIADEVAYQKKLQMTQGYFQPEMEVLELGCGTGSTAIIHSSYVRHIQTIDVSAKILQIARSKAYEQSITNVTFELDF